MLYTLDFTGSQHQAPFNFSWCTALILTLINIILKKVEGLFIVEVNFSYPASLGALLSNN